MLSAKVDTSTVSSVRRGTSFSMTILSPTCIIDSIVSPGFMAANSSIENPSFSQIPYIVSPSCTTYSAACCPPFLSFSTAALLLLILGSFVLIVSISTSSTNPIYSYSVVSASVINISLISESTCSAIFSFSTMTLT